MSIRTSTAALLLLSAALLTGCHVSFGSTEPKAVQAAGDTIKTASEKKDLTAPATSAQLEEDLRLANERASLAEEKAELEKQKRELAEERLKQGCKPDTEENEGERSRDKATGES